ncbi:MAG: MaoC family dehydratase [Actinomycetes bacterium]
MRVFSDPDSLRAAKGETLGSSGWHTITQQQVDRFADATGDHQWIHVDPDRAASGPFGGTIAHGYLTLSILPALGQEIYRFEGFRMGINYGLNKVRFPSPVKVGARVRSHAELRDVVDVPQGIQLVIATTVEVEGEDKPACVAEALVLLVP